MNINVRTNISNEYGDDIEIIINTSNYTKDVGKIVETLQQLSDEIEIIIGRNGNELSLININEVMYFYSNEQNNYCKTEKNDYQIKQKLYYLEETLPKTQFIRISNSTIINIKYVECFDVSTIGNIIVKLKNGIILNVSKRRVSGVMKFLKERGR